MKKLVKIKIIFITIVRRLTLTAGIFFLSIILLSFTETPFWMYYWLGVHSTAYKEKPGYIVLLGGGGMPGEQNLMRLFNTRQLAQRYPQSKIILSAPKDTINDSTLTVQYLMRKELTIDVINSARILKEEVGQNTRAEALAIKQLFPETQTKQIVIVTSPYHMLRALKTFRKLGFSRVGGQAAFESVIKHDIRFEEKKLGGRNLFIVPEIGQNTQLRYQFWAHLHYQVLCYREYIALAYYWLKGWI